MSRIRSAEQKRREMLICLTAFSLAALGILFVLNLYFFTMRLIPELITIYFRTSGGRRYVVYIQ